MDELESPYEYAGEYDGEIYFADGRNNVIGNPVAYTGTTDFALEKTLTEVRIQEEMPVKNVTVSEGKTILDFGQNFAGIVEIHPEFFEGETLTIRHGEILNQDGSLYCQSSEGKGDCHLSCRGRKKDLSSKVYLYGIPLCGTFRGGV